MAGKNKETYGYGYADDDIDSVEEEEMEEIRDRRDRRRRADSRARGWFIALTVIIVIAALCAVYVLVLAPRFSTLPQPEAIVQTVTGTVQRLTGRGGSASEQSVSGEGQQDGQNGISILSTQADSEKTADTASGVGGSDGQQETASAAMMQTEAQTQVQTQPATEDPKIRETLSQAAALAQTYDYDGAIALLQGIAGYESMQDVADAIAGYQSQKDSCVPVDVTTVPHIFYHSLINDTSRAFNADVLGQSQVDGFNAWMCTVDEFDRITQRLYDAGYVYVRLRDLVVETTDADGTVHFAPNTDLRLPEGKKAIVLSIDDCSYYHSYEPAGYPDRLVLDDNGKVKCHYVDAGGNESVGDYDVAPRLETFLEEHPDGCYKGARGIFAMTGYNGVFGYRTDTDYVKREHLQEDQAKWLADHPDFNYDEEVAEAKKIAQALKDEGWEFASHTWGHLSVTDKTVDELRADNEKWVSTVEPIVGKVDTIIFAHGNDIGTWEGYSSDNEKYAYYNSAGYHFYCNVDGSTPYWVQITDSYVRQGRIDVDGYRLWLCEQGEDTSLSRLIDTSGIFDSARPTPVVANGQS